MNFINKPIWFSAMAGILLFSCGGGVAPILSTPIENIDKTPLKEGALTEAEKKNWGHLDLKRDTIPGMSVDKAYSEIIKGKRGQTVIVAVIDSGIDIEHEDLDGVLWTNRKEIAGNGKDDDNNGYVDDIHGWNFLGDGYNEQLEFVRLVASGNTSAPRFNEAKAELEKKYKEAKTNKERYDQIYQQISEAHNTLTDHFKKSDYSQEEVGAIKTEDEKLKKAVQMANFAYSNGLESMEGALKEIKSGVEHFTDQLNYNLNKDFKGRKTNDNINDLNDIGYGNGNVIPVKESESHGTHVAGIIAAERNNGKGANGVANNVQIMSLRAVPNGDEYDKDIALAIRYAVDNGAKIINGSFGKSYSPHSDWVRDAQAYASKKGVIFVHAAGNSSENIDVASNFPEDNVNNGPEVSETTITVGALAPKYGSEVVAGFSNYGKNNVDVFAPGGKIYSTIPKNKYKPNSGTSMAAPAVAGVAALIMSQYPKLKAKQVKQIILNSGLSISTKVVVGGDPNNVKSLSDISKSGKMVNAYNALIMASQLQ